MGREMAPLRIAERSERRVDAAERRLERGEIGEARIETDISGDALNSGFGDEGADIVDDELADRRIRQRGIKHADDAAHRRADPIDALDIEPCDQSRDIAEIERIAVI